MELSKEDKIHQINQIIVKEKDNKYYTILNTIIEKYSLEHSTNKNGIFLNLSMLDIDIIDDIFFHFTNSLKKEEIVYEKNKEKPKAFKKQHIKEIKKDKLILEKFDKYILQASRGNIYI